MEKNTIYIYGNHDDKPFLQNHYLKFADEYTGEYYFKSGLTEFKIAHGHNEVPLSAYPWPVAKYFRIAEKIDKRTTFTKLMKSIERFYIKKFGILAIANSEKLHHRNELTKQYKDPAYFLICGDTHCPELDLKNKYANTGFIDNGFASYITVEN